MMKPVASSSLLVFVLCAPALADTPKVVPPPTTTIQQPLQLTLTVKVAADTRVHELAIFDNGCRRVEEKTSAYEDEIQICARPAPQGVFLDVDWRTRNGATEYRTSSGTVVARKGGKFEVGRVGGARFALQLQ